MTPYELILSKLDNPKVNGKQATARCPAHDDNDPSLSITNTSDGRVLVHCHAGCSSDEVCRAIGLKVSDLFPKMIEPSALPCPIDRDFSELNKRNVKNADTARLSVLAGSLGVSVDSLRQLGFGLNRDTWTVPERDAAGRIIGLATRQADGTKRSIKGSKRGLTYHWPLPEAAGASADNPILIVEGATDTAAGIDLGFPVVGRPGAQGGVDLLRDLLAGRHVVIVGENDQKSDTGKWPGQNGANQIAKMLHDIVASIVIVFPPPDIKDLRQWKQMEDCGMVLGVKICEAQAAAQSTEAKSSNRGEPIASGVNTDDIQKRQSQMILDLLFDAELFHYDDSPFATITVSNHQETHSLNSAKFRSLVQGLFYCRFQFPVSDSALDSALNVLISRAIFEGSRKQVFLRIGYVGNNVYLDLCNENWDCVEITATGYRVVKNAPIKFVRRRGMLPLPHPVPGGSANELRPLINAPDDPTWVLFVSTLIGWFNPRGPYPILSINGEQGSAKSTTCELLRELIDPNQCNLRAPISDERDLMIAATNAYLVGFDNLSNISPRLSDALCRLATGGGFSTRELYSNDEEKLFTATRPILLNGIEDYAVRPDLLDRIVQLNLKPIPDSARQKRKDIQSKFNQARPRILGALLDAVSVALRRHGEVNLENPPRMADFAHWVSAAEPALPWQAGEFMRHYTENRGEGIQLAIESSAIGDAFVEFAKRHMEWSGSAAELADQLNQTESCSDLTRRRRDWPTKPNQLSGAIRRLAPALRRQNIEVEFERSSKRRIIRLRVLPVRPSSASQASSMSSSAQIVESNYDATVTNSTYQASSTPVRVLPENTNNDGNDGDDALSDERDIEVSVPESLQSEGEEF